MKIIVCIKQVPDPEGPQSCFEINADALRVEPKGIPPVLSLFDENALEAAVRIKEKSPNDVKVSVLSMGKRISSAVMQKALAAGADDLVKVEDDALDSANLDSFGTAQVLAAAIKKMGAYDLIIAGRQAADWNAGQVGIGLAHYLGLPVATLARKVEVADGRVTVERLIPNGHEVVSLPLPAMVIASNEIGELRYPSMIQRRDAKKKPVTEWKSADLELPTVLSGKVVLKRLSAPTMRKGRCQILEGATPAEAARSLAQRLKNDGVI